MSPQVSGIVVGLLDPDGSRRVIAYGSGAANGDSLHGSSVFEIGSITKGFTGVLLADMIRRGEVEMTEPLAQLLPTHVRVPSRNGKQIRLLHLATHTSGLPPMPNNFPREQEAWSRFTVEDLYEFLSTHELTRDPGEEVEYSNLFTLLGHALANRAREPYEVLLRERVLAPLGMEQTGITLMPAMERHLTRGHDARGNPAPYFDIPAFIASGELMSSADDMLDFAAAHLSADTAGVYGSLRLARQPQRQVGDSQDWFGLGWGTGPAGEAMGHSGGTIGYSSYLYINTRERRALVVMANTAGRIANELGVHLLDPVKFPRPGAAH